MIKKNDVKYFFIIAFIAILYLSFLVVKPFITPILIATIFAFIFHPGYKWLDKKLKKPNLSSLIVAIVFVILISIPAFILLNSAVDEAQVFYFTTRQKFISGELFPAECDEESTTTICKVSSLFKNIITDAQFQYYINEGLKNVTKAIINFAQNFFLSIPKIMLSLFIIIFTTFYLTRDGINLVNKIKKLLPLKTKDQNKIMKQFQNITSAILFGYILTAMIQGLLGALMFAIVGISSPILWGVIMTIAAFIPFVGTAFIWGPAFLIQLGAGNGWQAITLLIGGLIIGNIDNFIRPKIIGDKAQIHPVIVLIGVLGGLFLFGLMGFLIGPIILALFLTFLNIYETETNEAKR
tara:strand:+ start:910 stop:1965 length:1056 start_codon:yes stop_codon:yes gene_type:complete